MGGGEICGLGTVIIAVGIMFIIDFVLMGHVFFFLSLCWYDMPDMEFRVKCNQILHVCVCVCACACIVCVRACVVCMRVHIVCVCALLVCVCIGVECTCVCCVYVCMRVHVCVCVHVRSVLCCVHCASVCPARMGYIT